MTELDLGKQFRLASHMWRSLLVGYKLLKNGLGWELGDAGEIQFWLGDEPMI